MSQPINTVEQINFLVFTADPLLVKQVQMAFALVPGAGKIKSYKAHSAGDMAQASNILDKNIYHSIIVDESFAPHLQADKLFSELKNLLSVRAPSQESLSLVFACASAESNKIQTYLKAGWTDVVVKPLDATLFVQKMHFYNRKILALASHALATMEYIKDVEIKMNFQCTTLSEYGMKIVSNTPLPLYFSLSVKLDFMPLPVNAVVRTIEKLNADQVTMDLMFIGLSSSQTQALRQNLAKHYSEKKG